ncbi:hypothetical protein F4779DRAFT_613709 [Xylariaceae sp. FL0662B]|nr:hypothetical protein F4779DRAFT_613709 [Xylariaceae sp. FL0662B]
MGQIAIGGATNQFAALRRAFSVGDLLTKKDCRKLRDLAPNARVINLFGSTESQRAVSFFEILSKAEDPNFLDSLPDIIPVGQGMLNVQLLVVDPQNRNRLCDVGEPGHLYIRAAGLAEGYRGDDEKTMELNRSKFVTNWFVDPAQWIRDSPPAPGYKGARDRLYWTGDLGRMREDGSVECTGRIDTQVKVRGFRVEFSENEEQTLVAYFVPETKRWFEQLQPQDDPEVIDEEIAVETMAGMLRRFKLLSDDCKKFLAAKLPSYAVPSRPGYITGDPASGICVTDDFVVRLWKCCLQVGARPDISNTVNAVPVTRVSAIVVAAALQLPAATGQYLGVAQVTSHPRLTLNAWIGATEADGYYTPLVPYRDWCAKVVGYVEDEAREEHALLPLSHFVTGDLPANILAPGMDDRQALAALKLYKEGSFGDDTPLTVSQSNPPGFDFRESFYKPELYGRLGKPRVHVRLDPSRLQGIASHWRQTEMDDSGASPEGASSEPSVVNLPEMINIVENGDLILDVTFENSKDTLRSVRRAQQKSASQEPQPALKMKVRLAFRVGLGTLKSQSKYFEKLLGNSRFKEAKDVANAFCALSLKNIKPGAADVKDLPWIKIHDDDEATHYAHRDHAFGDLLRILHGKETVTKPITMPFVTTLAVLADRFDCTATVSKYLTAGLKFKWPVTSRKPVRDEVSRMSRNNEDTLRQKILVSWLLNQPARFQAATKEIIVNGSCRWSSFAEDHETSDATWWYLQDGIEQELQFRRQCILNTIASVQRHFLGLYTSRTRQCKLGYDSSAACDSYQLGEMFKFLVNKNLMFLVDFSPGSLDSIEDTSLLQVDTILSTLRQCPSYQLDKNHTNCGLRTRILPILDFIQGLLSANSIPITRSTWKGNRQAAAWMPPDTENHDQAEGDQFRFTRSLAGDQRFRFENAMGADKFARDVFTASNWDWTAEDQVEDPVATTPRLSWKREAR